MVDDKGHALEAAYLKGFVEGKEAGFLRAIEALRGWATSPRCPDVAVPGAHAALHHLEKIASSKP